MNNKMEGAQLRDMRFAALAASATIVSFFLIYWAIQIQDTLEMLELAYG